MNHKLFGLSYTELYEFHLSVSSCLFDKHSSFYLETGTRKPVTDIAYSLYKKVLITEGIEQILPYEPCTNGIFDYSLSADFEVFSEQLTQSNVYKILSNQKALKKAAELFVSSEKQFWINKDGTIFPENSSSIELTKLRFYGELSVYLALYCLEKPNNANHSSDIKSKNERKAPLHHVEEIIKLIDSGKFSNQKFRNRKLRKLLKNFQPILKQELASPATRPLKKSYYQIEYNLINRMISRNCMRYIETKKEEVIAIFEAINSEFDPSEIGRCIRKYENYRTHHMQNKNHDDDLVIIINDSIQANEMLNFFEGKTSHFPKSINVQLTQDSISSYREFSILPPHNSDFFTMKLDQTKKDK